MFIPQKIYYEQEIQNYELGKELLEKYNRLILNKDWDFSIEKHSEEIIKMYNSI